MSNRTRQDGSPWKVIKKGKAQQGLEAFLREAQAAKAARAEGSTSLQRQSQRRAERLEELKAEMESRARLAEDEGWLLRSPGLRSPGLRSPGLPSPGLREALMATGEKRNEKRKKGEVAESSRLEQAAREVSQLEAEAAEIKAEAEEAAERTRSEEEALRRDTERACRASEKQVAHFEAERAESERQKAELLAKAEEAAAQIWKDSEDETERSVRKSEMEAEAAEEACRACEEACREQADRLREELRSQLATIRKEEEAMESQWAQALETIEARQWSETDEMQRMAAEHLESCLRNEQYAIQDWQVYARETLEDEVFMHVKEVLKVKHLESELTRRSLTTKLEEAVQALAVEELRMHRAVEATEQAEEEARRHDAETLCRLERLKRRLHERSTDLEQQVLLTKMRCHQQVMQEEQRAQSLEDEARQAAEQCGRVAWEKIAAVNLEAAEQAAQMRCEEERLKVEAQRLWDEAARLEASTQRMRLEQKDEEMAAFGLHQAVAEVETALQKMLQDCLEEEAMIHAQAQQEEAQIQESEAEHLARCELARQNLEFREEAASERCEEAAESAEMARRCFEEGLKELQQQLNQEDAKLRSKLQAAEDALASSLHWCEKQSQLGMTIFVSTSQPDLEASEGFRSPTVDCQS